MTQRFISIVSERSDTIGVRGEYTAELLGRLGIKNVEIIGCPSFYAQCESEFPVSDTTVTPLKKVAIHGSRPVARQAFNAERMRAVEDALLKDALDYESAFFAQNGLEETQLALDSNSLADWQLESLTDYYRSSPPDKVRKFFRESNHIFGDLEAWKNTLSEYDFVVGTRFHGNIVALHAGVRSFLLVHDRRTEELAELLRLPHRRIDDPIFDSRCEIRRLYEEADFAPARKAFAELYPRYKNLLNRSGVTHYLQ